jgi:choline dehydrogenase-like flavoprotein
MKTTPSEALIDGGVSAENVRHREHQRRVELRPHYDFIVCGSGSSGSVVARRLAESDDVSALLLEAGGQDDVPAVMRCAVAEELTGCLGMQHSTLVSYRPDGTALLLAARDRSGSTRMPVGERLSLEGHNVAGLVYRTGRAARRETHDHVACS